MRAKMKTICRGIGIMVVLFVATFCMGRYGWKLFGFNLCEGAGIEQVEVKENQVHMIGFYPGSFPSGFCGYYAEEKDEVLYVGFRFSTVFGFFENGKIDVTIPTKGKVKAVVLKTSKNEYVLTEITEDGTYQRPNRDVEQSMCEGEYRNMQELNFMEEKVMRLETERLIRYGLPRLVKPNQ